MKFSKIDLRPLESLFKRLKEPLTKKKRVLIVRHGQSEGNIKPLFYGSTDYPLTDIGRAQARLLSPVFTKYAHLFDGGFASSNLSRALETYRECLSGVENKNYLTNFEVRNWDKIFEEKKSSRITLEESRFKINENMEIVNFISNLKQEELHNILNHCFIDNVLLNDEWQNEASQSSKGS